MLPLLLVGAALVGGVVWARRHPRPFPAILTPFLESGVRRRFMQPDAFVRRLELRDGMRVLEIGPGGGMLTEAIAREAPGVALVCLDIQPVMLQKVRARMNQRRPALACGSATDLPFEDETFDRVVLVTVLGEVPDRAAAFRELRRVLTAGGRLAIGEALPDPDFIPASMLVNEAIRAGLAESVRDGPWFSYTQQFVRRDTLQGERLNSSAVERR